LFTVLFGIFLFQMGCTEPYEIETVNYENVLVVESTITDEFKQQIVKLSRTSSLEDTSVLIENNATVTVVSNNGDNFSFSQDNETGFYVSDQPFSAQPNTSYTLNIVTQDGKRYTSSSVVLPPVVEMDEVYTVRFVDPTYYMDGV